MSAILGLQRELHVVLDLDHTLVNAHGPLTSSEPEQNGRHLHSFVLVKPNEQFSKRYLLGLRDGLREFLQELARLATVHIYTHGQKSYAAQVLKIIDPTETLIKGRIRCMEDGNFNSAQLKKLEDIFDDTPRGGQDATATWPRALMEDALVLDDRKDMWDAMSREQLIQARLRPLSKQTTPRPPRRRTHDRATLGRCRAFAALTSAAACCPCRTRRT